MCDCFSVLWLPWDWLRSLSSASPFFFLFFLRPADSKLHVLPWVRLHGSQGPLERYGIYRVAARNAWMRTTTAMENDALAAVNTSTTMEEEEEEEEEEGDSHFDQNMVTSGHRTVSTKVKKRKKKKKQQQQQIIQGGGLHQHPMASRQRMIINGGNCTASLFTQKGSKQFNQDSMIVWKDFTSLGPTAVFCGVFDGHGPHGHFVSKNVRDMLPVKLAYFWERFVARHDRELSNPSNTPDKAHPICGVNIGGESDLIPLWEESLEASFKMMDHELLIDGNVDCVSSGTTALTLVKQGRDMIIAHVGDSRAVLGVKSSDDSLVALQLTVDLTPNVPKEAERIRRRKGRVFALASEPSVKRVWLPHKDFPGLAMSRALGDYSLKSYGVISAPEVFYRRIASDDKFVVLATDGVWDVLSNEQVVQIVDSTSERSLAAKAVVDAAVKLWMLNYAFVRRDDCAAVCLFLD